MIWEKQWGDAYKLLLKSIYLDAEEKFHIFHAPEEHGESFFEDSVSPMRFISPDE